MRTRILALLCTLLALAPPAAVAQGQEESTQEEPSTETEGAEVVDQGNAPAGKPGAPKETAPGEVHTVVKGDTLWDLSQRYLGNPWYWPKVWSYNPEIPNPHWIYPGNNVRFFPSLPGEPPVASTDPTEPEPQVTEEGQIPDEVQPEDTFDTGELRQTTLQVAGPIGYKPKDSAVNSFHQGFVTPREVDEAGTISGSFSEALMLSEPDVVYVTFKRRGETRLGDRYVVFHTETEVKHPITGARFGYLTKLLGTMKIVSVTDRMVTAQISDTWDAIQRGDLVGPSNERLNDKVSQRANERDLKGYVVAGLVPMLTMMGEHHIILIDKGSADGVLPGNTFAVVRQGEPGNDIAHPAAAQDKRYPTEDIAVCMVVETKERASNCLLTRSLREVVPGDRVEMRIPRSNKVSQR